jgi:hypothetical protein
MYLKIIFIFKGFNQFIITTFMLCLVCLEGILMWKMVESKCPLLYVVVYKICGHCYCLCPNVRLELVKALLLSVNGILWIPGECVCPNFAVGFWWDHHRCAVIVCLFFLDVLPVFWMGCNLLRIWMFLCCDVFVRMWLGHLSNRVVVVVSLVWVCWEMISILICIDPRFFGVIQVNLVYCLHSRELAQWYCCWKSLFCFDLNM